MTDSEASLAHGAALTRRLYFMTCAITTIVGGLASRRYGDLLPPFVTIYLGDMLWGLMMYWLVSLAFPLRGQRLRGGVSLALACAVEISQLYQAPWLDAIRRTTIGGLVLGFDFVWSDIVCYAVGVAVGILSEYCIRELRREPDALRE